MMKKIFPFLFVWQLFTISFNNLLSSYHNHYSLKLKSSKSNTCPNAINNVTLINHGPFSSHPGDQRRNFFLNFFMSGYIYNGFLLQASFERNIPDLQKRICHCLLDGAEGMAVCR